MRILIVAGELSADRFAADIAMKLIQHHGASIVAIGGPHLQGVSETFIGDCTAHVSVGLGDRLKGIRPIFSLLDKLGTYLKKTPVNRAIIVDFPNFNFEIARRLCGFQIPIDTVITPNFWIWKDLKSAKRVVAYSNQIITIFPPEFSWYKQLSPSTYYFGHPISDRLRVARRPIRDLSHSITIGLFPGSRFSELRLYLAPMVKAAARIKKNWPEAQFILTVARPEFTPYIDAVIAPNGPAMTLSPPLSDTDMEKLDIAVCATGTMSLELVFHRIPTVVLGALPRITYWIARFFLRLRLPFVGLPNIVANSQVVPELAQSAITSDQIVNAVTGLTSPADQSAIQDRYDMLTQQLAPTGTESISKQIADQIGCQIR